MFGVFFYVSLYVQKVLGYSPTQAGAAFLPWTILIILVAPIAGRLSRPDRRAPARDGRPASSSRARSSASRGSGARTSFWNLLPGMILGGVGMALRDGADDRGRDGLRAARQGGRRLGRAEQHRARSAARSASRSWARSSPPASRARSRPATRGRSRSSTASTTRLIVAGDHVLVGAVIAFATLARTPRPSASRSRRPSSREAA